MNPFTGASIELRPTPHGPQLAVVVRNNGAVLGVAITPQEWTALVADGNTKAAQLETTLSFSELDGHCRELVQLGLLTDKDGI